MTDREELLELMKEALEDCRSRTTCRGCKGDYKGKWCQHVLIADHLIENGVTVQRWIPASELPEDYKNVLVYFEYFRYGSYNRPFRTVGISYTFRGEWSGTVNGQSGWHDLKILAWMPLPDTPKDGD